MNELIYLYYLLVESQKVEIKETNKIILFASYLEFFIEEMELKFKIKLEIDLPLILKLKEKSNFSLANLANSLVIDEVRSMKLKEERERKR